MSTIVEKSMQHHPQSHSANKKLLPHRPPVLNIFSLEEGIFEQSLLPPSLPVLSLEEDIFHQSLLSPNSPVLSIFPLEEHIVQQSSRQICWDQIYDNYTNGNYGFNNATITTPTVLKDEYKLVREIGRGAFGVVHEAIHIKVFPRSYHLPLNPNLNKITIIILII